MEEYIKTLLEQIRYKKVHGMIEEEIRSHMEDQIEANLAYGMTKEEAVRETVNDMGDPVETGIALDHIHRPAVAGEMIVIMLIVAMVSIVIQMLIGDVGVHGDLRLHFVFHTLMGFLIMLFIYHLDYRFLALWGKRIACFMIGMLFLATLGIGVITLGGSYRAFEIGTFLVKFTIYAFMMLYVPIYGSVLYQYYGTGINGVKKSVGWIVVPVILSFRLNELYLSVVLLLSLSVVLSIAVWKKWFGINRVRFLISYWGFIFIMPIICIYAAFHMPLLPDYQTNRILAFLGLNGYTYQLRDTLMGLYQQMQMLGDSGSGIVESFVDFDSTYIFTYITAHYGIIIASLILILIHAVTIKIFQISFTQKNQLGMIMGCGCGSVFVVNTVLNLAQNFGLLPVSGSFLPFFTYGGSFQVMSYVLMGIILSVYRHKNVVPVRFKSVM